MNEPSLPLRETLDSLPPEWSEDLSEQIQQLARASGRKVVVLDDDPTGTQTVHGIPVLTDWPVESLAAELASDDPAVYLLTNSRSLPLPEAQALNRETGLRISMAQAQTGREVVVISRSDSTLRGHFPGEVDALAEALGGGFDARLVIPFFPEGGRYTIDDVHYVAEGDWLVPAGQTAFARDKSFGYRASNLREWVAEKSGGTLLAENVASISLETLRQGGPETTYRALMELPPGAECVVNAASYRDLEVLALALLQAEAAGKRYLYRTAASFVRMMAGITPRPLLQAAELDLPETGAGLVIAGSYVPKTSAQLDALMRGAKVQPVEVQVNRLLDAATNAGEIERVLAEVNALLEQGQDTVVYTSRKLVSTEGAEANLAIGRAVSDGLVAIVRGRKVPPRYLLAKGGITSSDVATLGLGIKRATVVGQILPGVPVWRSGPESLFPGLAYIVFPGNVGGEDALAKIVDGLH